ncbi:hypothetical protein Bca4012_018503 [Brassica carinata]
MYLINLGSHTCIKLVSDLGFHHDHAIVYYLANNQVHHERTKHIDIRYHFLRDGTRIQVKKVETDDNPVNLFTRPVPLASSSIVLTC